MLEEPEPGAFRNELQAFRNSLVRVVIKVAMVPGLKALFITPVRQEPNLVLIIQGADNLETNKSRGIVYEAWAIAEGIFHLGGHVVGDGELTQGNEHLI